MGDDFPDLIEMARPILPSDAAAVLPQPQRLLRHSGTHGKTRGWWRATLSRQQQRPVQLVGAAPFDLMSRGADIARQRLDRARCSR
jgi:hypothetical protein